MIASKLNSSWLVALVALAVAACDPGQPAGAAAEQAAPNREGKARPPVGEKAPPASEAPKAPSEPVVAKAPAPAPAPTPPAAPTRRTGEEPDMKALEGQPGATPALEDGRFEPAPGRAKLGGAPGPSPSFGPADAPVVVFIFSDFQCPVCKRVVEPLKAVAREYAGKVRFVFFHNALEMHRNAAGAAAAAIAAFRQGHFWAYHDKLFANQRQLSRADLIRYAGDLGLDTARLEADMDDPATAAQIAHERAIAEALGARGTPGFFVNGKKQVGWASYGGFKATVGRAVAEAAALAAPGLGGAEIAKRATKAAGEDGAKLVELIWGEK